MKKSRPACICLFVILLLLSAIGVWKTVYLNADIDESYALTMACRLVKGDRLFVAMWEPHQLSALLYAPFVWIFKSITGSFDGALIFMRWIGIVIQGLVSVLVYQVLKKHYGSLWALLLAGLYFNYTPKHIQSPEFTSLTYWFTMLFILCLIQFVYNQKEIYIILAGICMSGLVLCYPAMLLLFVVCLIWLLYRKQGRPAGLFVLSCVFLGLVCMGYLALASGMGAVLKNISNVLADASHKQSIVLTWKNHILVMWDMLKVTLPCIVLVQVGRPVLDKKGQYNRQLLTALLAVQTAWSIWQFHTIEHVNFLLLYPIVFQFCILGFYVGGWMLPNGEKKNLLGICALVSFTQLVAILASSNLDANYSVAFLLPMMLLGLPAIGEVFARESKGAVYTAICVMAILVLCLQIFAARILLVRYTSTQRYNIFAGYYETYRGSLSGVHLSALDYQQYEAKLNALAQYVDGEDTFLFVGCDMFLYSSLADTRIGTGNTISTPDFSEQLIHYYELNPDRVPTVMFVDREYAADFTTVLSKEPFRGFMQQYFDLDHPLSGGPVDVYVR